MAVKAFWLGLAILFVGCAAVEPAQSAHAPKEVDSATPSRLGMLKTRDHVLHFFATADGPRYTVVTHDGEVLKANLSADQLAEQFEELAKAVAERTGQSVDARLTD